MPGEATIITSSPFCNTEIVTYACIAANKFYPYPRRSVSNDNRVRRPGSAARFTSAAAKDILPVWLRDYFFAYSLKKEEFEPHSSNGPTRCRSLPAHLDPPLAYMERGRQPISGISPTEPASLNHASFMQFLT